MANVFLSNDTPDYIKCYYKLWDQLECTYYNSDVIIPECHRTNDHKYMILKDRNYLFVYFKESKTACVKKLNGKSYLLNLDKSNFLLKEYDKKGNGKDADFNDYINQFKKAFQSFFKSITIEDKRLS